LFNCSLRPGGSANLATGTPSRYTRNTGCNLHCLLIDSFNYLYYIKNRYQYQQQQQRQQQQQQRQRQQQQQQQQQNQTTTTTTKIKQLFKQDKSNTTTITQWTKTLPLLSGKKLKPH
jgi:hypothetical protein